MKVTKKDEAFIDSLARTDTIRAIAELVKDLNTQEISQLIATFIFFTAKDEEDEAISWFLKDQFLQLLPFFAKAAVKVIPEVITDTKFIKKIAKLGHTTQTLKELIISKKKPQNIKKKNS